MATIVRGKNKNKPWTVRYFHEGRQREKSFQTKREADDFKARFDFERRENTFVDPRLAGEKFRDAAQGWIDRHTGTARTKATYSAMLRNHINPAMGDRRLRDIATDREGLQTFLLVTMPAKKQGASQIRQAYLVINAVVNDAIRTGKLASTRIRGIPLPPSPRTKADDFVFPDKMAIRLLLIAMPRGYSNIIYLMRGCGLRISEALAVEWGDFIEDNTVLRVRRQMAPDGKTTIPLKHRKEGEYRDVPVPVYVQKGLGFGFTEPQRGPLFPPVSRRAFSEWFNRARDKAEIDKRFTPHSLRHVFASVALSQGVPITDVSRWLGHRNIQTTFSIYSHFVPSSWDRAREALDGEWAA